jgi:predicted transcriptional regulator
MKIVFDDFVDAIANVQRRKLLLALVEADAGYNDEPAVSVDEFVAWDTQRQIQMQHSNLPKLASYGLITWNRNENMVTPGPNFEEVKPTLELLRSNEERLPPDVW